MENFKEIYLQIIIPFLKRSDEISDIYLNSPNDFFEFYKANYIENYEESIKAKVYTLTKKLARLSNEYTAFVANLNMDIILFHILKTKIKKEKNEMILQCKNNEKEYKINKIHNEKIHLKLIAY